MHITSIQVSASRGFNHPHEKFANFRFDLHLQASLDAGDNPDTALIELQRKAEQAAEAHKKAILDEIERERLIAEGEEQLRWMRRESAKQDEYKDKIRETEEMLIKLRAVPAGLTETKQIHPGHADHPATHQDDDLNYFEPEN